ncbi:hypothetical protein [Legionella feeleii]|uniref:Uncharacterized protein n=1 Tax=Legionella feeleii TaxID=453 RepID=A0A378IR40_9GAMM|nr:hypothetical protein [Legionella feeleii]STX36961.1 Uncharacterised protein [Legionella feeleii]
MLLISKKINLPDLIPPIPAKPIISLKPVTPSLITNRAPERIYARLFRGKETSTSLQERIESRKKGTQ